MAPASRKLLTTAVAGQPTCGGRTISPQHGPPPTGGPGTEAGCTLLLGMTEHPLASAAAASSAVITTVRRPGRRTQARRGSGIDAPPFGAPRPAAAVGGVGHGVHADD